MLNVYRIIDLLCGLVKYYLKFQVYKLDDFILRAVMEAEMLYKRYFHELIQNNNRIRSILLPFPLTVPLLPWAKSPRNRRGEEGSRVKDTCSNRKSEAKRHVLVRTNF